MRIGVMTFFESDNYGTVLQAYALQAYLEKLGHSVQLIQLKRNVHAKGNQREEKSRKPSFGVEKIGDENIFLQMKEQLAKYHTLLVREESGVKILHSMGLRAEQVVDPVFLDKNLWNKFITPDSPFKGSYGVIYALVDYPDSDDARIHSYAKAKGLKLVILPENRRNCMTTYRKRFSLSPQEFVNYIAHCEVVFTNSFHGMAFGLLMEKKL